jgi:glutamate-1-semialdehyde 2,1-aminomutase
MATALERNYWFYVPTEGVYWAAGGSHYPLFVRDAKGASFIDAEGQEYIDYVMGWGACFLGYAAAPIADAVARTLTQTPLSALPNLLELELCEALAARFPCAEMTLFGKNGSDVTTAAVRLARNATGRPFVLFGGYHGWHDWNSPSLGNEPASADFASGDLAAVEAHFAQRPGQIAAVVVEPAARVAGIDGPVSVADADFLGALRRLCDREGSLLVYDEIWTGFRYLDGSVMAHTGVIPDLVCLGKALANGMPLAALTGRSEIFRSAIHRINYTPTFKGEVYSFAAALAALEVYRERDVAAEVWAYGRNLMEALDERFSATGVPLAMSGLPVRMVPAFQIDDVRRRTLARTLLQQELLKAGIVSFRGFMLPSAAHGEREFEQTLAAFDRALPVVRRALETDGFARVLEVPEIG